MLKRENYGFAPSRDHTKKISKILFNPASFRAVIYNNLLNKKNIL